MLLQLLWPLPPLSIAVVWEGLGSMLLYMVASSLLQEAAKRGIPSVTVFEALLGAPQKPSLARCTMGSDFAPIASARSTQGSSVAACAWGPRAWHEGVLQGL